MQDKAMMGRWGLEGMRSFEQVDLARKEGGKVEHGTSSPFTKGGQTV